MRQDPSLLRRLRAGEPTGRQALARLLDAGLWTAALGSGAVALSNLAGIQGGFLVSTVQTLLPLTLVGAAVVLMAAGGLRRWALAAVSAVAVAAHLALVLPALGSAPPGAASEGDATRMRVFSANLRFDNSDIGPIAGEILRSDADVVALQEVTEAHLAAMTAAGVLDSYPHSLLDPQPGAFGSAILSRTPLTDARVEDLAGVPLARATLMIGGRPVELLNVHTMAPIGEARVADRDRQLDALARSVGARAGGNSATPRIVVGDFNASRWHPAFRRLLGSGLHDAHEQTGRGLARSWPNESLVPAFALLDHVLLTPTVSAVAVREGAGEGSDHRPVVADLRVRWQLPAPTGAATAGRSFSPEAG